jgi:hypothetical protein
MGLAEQIQGAEDVLVSALLGFSSVGP